MLKETKQVKSLYHKSQTDAFCPVWRLQAKQTGKTQVNAFLIDSAPDAKHTTQKKRQAVPDDVSGSSGTACRFPVYSLQSVSLGTFGEAECFYFPGFNVKDFENRILRIFIDAFNRRVLIQRTGFQRQILNKNHCTVHRDHW